MLDVFERVQKCLMAFLTCWMKSVMFERFALTFNMLYNILIDFLMFLMGFSNVLIDFSNFANVRCRFNCLVLAINLTCCCQFNTNCQTCCMTCCITCYMTCLNCLLRALTDIEKLFSLIFNFFF